MTGNRDSLDRTFAADALLDYLNRSDYRPVTQRQLLHRLQLSKSERPAVRRVLERLLEEGRVAKIGGGRLVPGEGALRDRPAAVRRTVGIFRRKGRGKGGVVEPFDPSAGAPIVVRAAFRMGARTGDTVSLEILRSTDRRVPAEGKIVEVLGHPEDPGVDVLAVIRQFGLTEGFSEQALAEARAFDSRIDKAVEARRERFEDPAPVTIDGETAQDFDDAVAVAPRGRGGFRLFVHIADVSHFVEPGSALDRDARARGTSVYFPGTVLPMLPARLSNDLCSLNPRQERLVQSVVVDLSRQGKIEAVKFADGLIRSRARLTYTQVGAFLDGKRRGHGVPRALQPMLLLADELRGVLERRRQERGSVDFDLPEPQILLDVEGAMTGVTVEPRNKAHRLIEEFMLVANEAVASHMKARRRPFMFRVHEKPDPAKVELLADFARSFGLALGGNHGSLLPRDIQRLLRDAQDRKEYPVIAQVALRSMKQARYSTENVGHFGLAAPFYTHFTSPIRRYPDLVVHRQLRGLRRRRPSAWPEDGAALEQLAQNCSTLERNAEAAERALLAWKKIAFIKTRQGETFDGVITGVTGFGLFVQLTESLVEGLLRVERLGDDYYAFNESRLELRGRSTGRSFRLGDRLRVRLDHVDEVLHRVDLSLPERRDRGGARGAPRKRDLRRRVR